MDLLDKSIVLELMTNSRVSCQELAENYNSTRGVVRKRIKRLEEMGVIQEYSAWYSLAMVDAEFVFGHVRVSQQIVREEIIKELVQHPMIHAVIPLATGDIIFHANVVGTEGLSNLGTSIRKLEHVNEVELNLIKSDRGKKVELKKIHFQIMSTLFCNSRISVAEISRRAKLSPRRVKRALNEIESDGGIVLAIARNPALGSGVSFYVKIYWDDREADVKELVELIGEEFPVETWESYISASDSVLYTRFFVEHMKNVESISNRLSQFEAIKKLETLVFYPARISSVMTRDCLLDDICKAGYDIFGD